MAKNHQYIGVNKVLENVKDIKDLQGKLGVFWHTQGSGKSYSMVFLCEKIHRKLGGSYTFLIVVDRTELENQAYDTFSGVGIVNNKNIIVDSTTTYQTVDGFGYTLTDGSAQLIYSMPPAQRANLLTDLFSQTNGIGVSYLRLTIGASDLSSSAYTYNDLASGTDVNLTNFSIAPAMTNLIPLLKEIKD